MRFSFYKHWKNKELGVSIFYYISPEKQPTND